MEKILLSVVNNTTEIVFVRDLAGRYLMMNPAGAAIMGRKPADFVGKTDAELSISPEVAQRIVQEDAHILETGQGYTYELPMDINGQRRVYLITKGLARDDAGNPCAIFGISRDITDRKLAEEQSALLAREAAARAEAEAATRRSEFLIRSGEILLSTLDSKEILTRLVRVALPHFAEWCTVDMLHADGSVRRETFAHRDPAVEELARERQQRMPIPPNSFPTIVETIRSGRTNVRNRLTEADLLEIVRGPEGLKFVKKIGIGSYVCVPLRSRAGVIGAVTFVAREPGRFGNAEVALTETLIHSAGLAIENARLYEESLRAIEVRDDFLAIASHELRTPLTIFKAQVDLFLRLLRNNDLGRLSTDDMVKLFESSNSEIMRFVCLVNNLLDVSATLGGNLRLKRETFDLSEMIRSVVNRMEADPNALHRLVELHANTEAHGHWDKMNMDQILTNLLSNALKYGSGKPIRVGLTSDADTVSLTVRDQGIGIAENDLQRIFERFTRATDLKSADGLGLGLYIVRKLVEAHGGTITVSSQLGSGSEFVVVIPRQQSQSSS